MYVAHDYKTLVRFFSPTSRSQKKKKKVKIKWRRKEERTKMSKDTLKYMWERKVSFFLLFFFYLPHNSRKGNRFKLKGNLPNWNPSKRIILTFLSCSFSFFFSSFVSCSFFSFFFFIHISSLLSFLLIIIPTSFQLRSRWWRLNVIYLQFHIHHQRIVPRGVRNLIFSALVHRGYESL